MPNPAERDEHGFLVQEATREIQEQLGALTISASEIDLDGFIELIEAVTSPQAVARGLDLSTVQSAAGWAVGARLLKPFWDHAVERVEAIKRERRDAAFG